MNSIPTNKLLSNKATRRILDIAMTNIAHEIFDGKDNESFGIIISRAFMKSPKNLDHLCEIFSKVDADYCGKYLKGGSAREFLEGIAMKYKRQVIESDMGL